ncbi:MAG: hypothetical protein AB1465_03815 [Patescibacteria group bacterium]
MKEKIKKYFKNIILLISLYLVSYAFMDTYFSTSYSDEFVTGIYALATTILIIYVYKNR